MNVVVVAPHPDDEIIGVGGTIVKHAKNGDDVYVVTVTKGDESFYEVDYVNEGRRQQEEADGMLGIRRLIRIDLPSPLLDTINHVQLVNKIQSVLRSLNPHVVYIPHYGDMHIEHKIVAECCMVALRPKQFEELEIYGYEVPSETGWDVPCQQKEFIPNVYVRLTDEEFGIKKEALSVFKSQIGEYPSARSIEAIEALAKYRGSTVGTHQAEAFMLIRKQRS